MVRIETNEIGIFKGVIQIGIPTYQLTTLDKLQEMLDTKKVPFVVSIDIKRKRRSLDANSCLWATLNDMAIPLHTTAEELYLMMLKRYGVKEFLAVIPEAIPILQKTFRVVEVMEKPPITMGKRNDALTVKVCRGSSTYNSQEFSILLDGVMEEAKEIGVNYVSKADRDLLCREWGKKCKIGG